MSSMHSEILEPKDGATLRPRIVVVYQPHSDMTRLLRVAKRKSQTLNLSWEVLFVSTESIFSLARPRQELDESIAALAEQMGAIVTRVKARNRVEAVTRRIQELEQQGVSVYSIKVAEASDGSLRSLFTKDFVEQLRDAVADRYRISTISTNALMPRKWRVQQLFHVNLEEMGKSLLFVLVATFLIYGLDRMAPDVIGRHNPNTALVYIIACAISAGRYGMLAGLTAAVASFLTLNLLFVSPYYNLIIDDRNDALNLALFLIVSVMIALLSSREHGSRLTLMHRLERINSLLKVHRTALSEDTPQAVIERLKKELEYLLGTDVAIFLPSAHEENRLEVVAPRQVEINFGEQSALQTCWEEAKTTGKGTAYQPDYCRWRFEPLTTTKDEIGALGIKIGKQVTIDSNYNQLLAGIADQVALIVERMHLDEISENNRVQVEREKLRSMLLSSVSHDLKTPLASVIGSLGVYRSMGERLPDEQKKTLINTALDEAQRLDSFITNILDMTRIESGQVQLKQEWVRPRDLVTDVQKRLHIRLRNHTLVYKSTVDDFEIHADIVMTGQVIQNLLDNAGKYTPEGSHIEISWGKNEPGEFFLSIRDTGAGIPESYLDKVFDKYARIKKQDSQAAGTGLGLAIAKAVMREQGGNITASNHVDGGAIFTISLPRTRSINQSKVA